MKYLKKYQEYSDDAYIGTYIGVKNIESNYKQLLSLGYKFDDEPEYYKNSNEYIWIQIYEGRDFGMMYYGVYNERTDILLDITDIPKREDLDEYVNFLKDGSKLGLI